MRKAVAAGMLLVVTQLSATESRVAGLGGEVNLLFDDDALVERYPSLLFQFGQIGVLELRTLADLTGGTPTGYVKLFHAGENYASGFYVNYPVLSYLGTTAYGLRYAGAFGGDTRFGYAVDLGLHATSSEDDANPANKTQTRLYAFGLTLGASGSAFDGALNITFPMYKNRNERGNNYQEITSSKPQMAANFRYFMERSEASRLIFALNFGLTDQSFTRDNNGNKTDVDNQKATTFGLLLGLNTIPVENVLLVGGLGLGFGSYTAHNACQTFDPAANKCSIFNLNGILGLEGRLTGALTGRVAALKNLLTYASTERPDADNNTAPDLKTSTLTQFPISYVLGLSYAVRNVRFDATIAPHILYNGPYFIFGRQSFFVNTLSVHISF